MTTLCKTAKSRGATVKRIPIPMNAQEEKALTALADRECRSLAAMAKIIYQLGLKAYAQRRTK